MFSPFKSFGFEYQWNGGEYSFSVLAESEDEARSRVDAMGESRFCGEVKEELPRVFELAEGTRVQIDGLPYFVKGRAEVAGFVKPNSLACEARYGELSATNDQVNRDAASVVPTSETADGGSGSTPCSFSAIDSATKHEVWDGLITMDMFSDRSDFGSYIHVADVGMLFIQYLEDSGEVLQRCLEKADKEGQILAGDVCQYKPAMKFFGRTST